MFGRDALNLLVTQLQTATANYSPVPTIAVGWPQLDLLMNTVGKNKGIVVSLYDHGMAKDASRFMLFTANEVLTNPGVVSTLSSNGLTVSSNTPTADSGSPYADSGNSTWLAPGQTLTITLSGTLLTSDAVSFVISSGALVNAAVAVAASTDTLDSLASQLSAYINGDLGTYVSATVANAVVTVTNTSASILQVASNVGNIGTRYVEVDRKIRSVQVDLWAPTVDQRDGVGRLIDQQLAYLDAHFGMPGVGGATDDGTWVRVRDMGDQFVDTDVYRNLYRWMWHTTLEYGQTYAETLYSVLAFMPSQTVQATLQN